MEMKMSIFNIKSLLCFRAQSAVFFRLRSEHNPDLNECRLEKTWKPVREIKFLLIWKLQCNYKET